MPPSQSDSQARTMRTQFRMRNQWLLVMRAAAPLGAHLDHALVFLRLHHGASFINGLARFRNTWRLTGINRQRMPVISVAKDGIQILSV